MLRRLNPGKNFSRTGEQILVPNVESAEALPKGGRIVINRSARTLTLFDTAGRAIAQFPASTGSGDDPLPVDNWTVTGVSTNPVFYYDPKLFWDANAGEKKARIPPGQNNPVGVAWIDPPKPHYGIYGTPLPASIGKSQSHGGIRPTNWSVGGGRRHRCVILLMTIKLVQLSDNFDQRRGTGRHHGALIIMAPKGSKVIKLFSSKPGGLTLCQSDPSEKHAYCYVHLDRYADGIKQGSVLKRGELVGYVGVTGNAAKDAPHLHFAVFELTPKKKWWKGTAVNPYPMLGE